VKCQRSCHVADTFYRAQAIRHLVDIRLEYLDVQHPGFKLLFEFESNEFFEDSVLEKTYYYQVRPARRILLAWVIAYKLDLCRRRSVTVATLCTTRPSVTRSSGRRTRTSPRRLRSRSSETRVSHRQGIDLALRKVHDTKAKHDSSR
jgi:hypothetical protein